MSKIKAKSLSVDSAKLKSCAKHKLMPENKSLRFFFAEDEDEKFFFKKPPSKSEKRRVVLRPPTPPSLSNCKEELKKHFNELLKFAEVKSERTTSKPRPVGDDRTTTRIKGDLRKQIVEFKNEMNDAFKKYICESQRVYPTMDHLRRNYDVIEQEISRIRRDLRKQE